jgi:hypothetical protein
MQAFNPGRDRKPCGKRLQCAAAGQAKGRVCNAAPCVADGDIVREELQLRLLAGRALIGIKAENVIVV